MLHVPVEHATLRPVPLRPVGPVDPADALAHVLRALPDLSEDAARALALVEIAGRTRDSALAEMEMSSDVLAELLYEGRKALRRSIFPLSASGWCERAEHLLSDRIDGVLKPPGPARLDVHLRNCERCVDHERRLSQARERLVREFIETHPQAAGAGPAERPVAALRVVEPVVVESPVWDGPTHVVAGFGGVAVQLGDNAPPVVSFAGPGGQVEIRVEASPVAEVPEREELPDDPPLDADVAPAEPADATPSEDDATLDDPPVQHAAATAVSSTAGLEKAMWHGLLAVSISLAVFALIVTVLALVGVQSIF